jgi:hypothetical protein
MGMDLKKMIDKVSQLSVGDDPLVVENRAKAREMLAGTAPKLQAIDRSCNPEDQGGI